MSRYLLVFLLNVFLKNNNKTSGLCSSPLTVDICRHESRFCHFPPLRTCDVGRVCERQGGSQSWLQGESPCSSAVPGAGSDPQIHGWQPLQGLGYRFNTDSHRWPGIAELLQDRGATVMGNAVAGVWL